VSTQRVILEAGEITAALVEFAWRKLGHPGFPPAGIHYDTFVVMEESKGEVVITQARVELTPL
jgi:hypothetical protein